MLSITNTSDKNLRFRLLPILKFKSRLRCFTFHLALVYIKKSIKLQGITFFILNITLLYFTFLMSVSYLLIISHRYLFFMLHSLYMRFCFILPLKGVLFRSLTVTVLLLSRFLKSPVIKQVMT